MDESTEGIRNGTLQTLSAGEFVSRLQNFTRGNSEAKFAFFIGAGCSVTSGVPIARDLVRERWIPRLRDVRAPEELDALAWAEGSLGLPMDNLPDDAYGRVMTELFPQPALRQAEMEELCSAGRPGFGYATLAQLMAEPGGRFNVALTTNFDDFIRDALYLFVGAAPLVIDHGALSPFVRPTRARPLVLKLHGHHQFQPLNTQEETQRIEQGLADGASSLLHDRGLIFLGYRGGDEGVYQMLRRLPAEALPYGVYWVSGKEPTGALRPWLEERRAIWVQHRGFDELMVQLRDKFGLEMPQRRRIEATFEAVEREYISLSERIKADDEPAKADLRDAAERVDKTVPDWAVYELRARRLRAADPEAAEREYLEGIRDIPDSVPLHGNLANLLKDNGKYEEAETYYKSAMQLDPNYPNVLHDYAIYLWRHLGQESRAREFLTQAMQGEVGDSLRLGNYANFKWLVDRDPDGAERTFWQAVRAPGTSPDPFRQFALFMQEERGDFRRAEELYEQAFLRKSDDIHTMVNFASFATTMGDVETARQMLERAYAVDEESIFARLHLAGFLWNQRLDVGRAGQLYRAARAKGPKNRGEHKPFAALLGDYALYHARELGSPGEGLNLLAEASELLPDDPNVAAFHGSYIASETGQPGDALRFLDAWVNHHKFAGAILAIKANIYLNATGDVGAAEAAYRKALELEPRDALVEANLGGLLLASGQTDEGMALCKSALRRVGRAMPAIAIEGYFYLFAHGSPMDQAKGLQGLKWLLADGLRSPKWDLTRNIAQAVADGHPEARWLPRLAGVISGNLGTGALADWPSWARTRLPALVHLDLVEDVADVPPKTA